MILALMSHAVPLRKSWPISYLFLEKDFPSWPDLFLNNFYQITVALAPGEEPNDVLLYIFEHDSYI